MKRRLPHNLEERAEYEEAIGLSSPAEDAAARFHVWYGKQPGVAVVATCLLGWHDLTVETIQSDQDHVGFNFGERWMTVKEWRRAARDDSVREWRWCPLCRRTTVQVPRTIIGKGKDSG